MRKTCKISTVPTLYPNEVEFIHPMRYIRSIRNNMRKYGACKIVPPSSWDFKTQLSSKYNFLTRKQNLCEMNAQTRERLTFVDGMMRFHLMKGTPFSMKDFKSSNKFVDFLYVDRYLNKDYVDDETQWKTVASAIGYEDSSKLEEAYKKYVIPYKSFCASIEHEAKCHRQGLSSYCGKGRIVEGICSECFDGIELSDSIFCEDCDHQFHVNCVPKGIYNSSWYCLSCIVLPGNDFGFETGKNRTLADFKNYDAKCKAKLKSSTKKWPSKNEEDFLEKLFWEATEKDEPPFSIEYGADLSTFEVSGFPKGKRGYGGHPFNLNNLPRDGESLFKCLENDIDGVTRPWLYLGMVFSCFSWHVEDLKAYSINYHHFGATKTWYCIPEAEFDTFIDYVHQTFPFLIRSQDNLLKNLTTIMNPFDILSSGIPLYKIHQRPGEFVLTMPGAFHSGFNHGFNIAEAVNLAPLDWIPIGLQCKRYKKPVLSLKKLIFTYFYKCLDSRSIVRDFIPFIIELLKREFTLRSWMKNNVDIQINSQDLILEDILDGSGPNFCDACDEEFLLSFVSFSDGKVRCLECFYEKFGTDDFEFIDGIDCTETESKPISCCLVANQVALLTEFEKYL